MYIKRVLMGVLLLLLIIGWRIYDRDIAVDVVGCSSNITVDDAKKLIDGNGLKLPEGESWMLLSLRGKTKISRIEIDVADTVEVAVINTDGAGNKVWQKMDIKDTAKEMDECSYVKLEFSTNTQEYVKSIKVFGEHKYPKYIDDNMDVIADADNQNNPLYVHRIPLRKYLYLLADDILGENKDSLTDHQKMILFMKYVEKYKVGGNKSHSEDYLTDWIKTEIGACGDYSSIVAALAYTQGIKTRLLTMANYPSGSGHACIEAWIDGRWSFYDPTYALFYTKDDNKQEPYLLSFEDLCRGDGYKTDVHKVLLNPNRLFSDVSYQYTGPDIYVKANPKGVVSPFVKLYYPITITYKDARDATMASRFQGGTYLGAACISNCWDVNVNNLTVGQRYIMCIKSTGMGGEDKNDFRTIVSEWDNCELIDGREKKWPVDADVWEIIFEAHEPNVLFKVDHNAVGDKFKYVNIDSIFVTTNLKCP